VDHAAEVQEWLDARSDEMAELLMRLVAVNTENPPGRGLRDCARVLAEAMRDLDVASEVIDVDAAELEGACVVRGGLGDGRRIVYFHGHFDVVPAQSQTQFEPRREDGRIIGRGAADMKGGLVSMLYGAAAARELGLLDDTRVVFHLVCDEETGSAVGSGHLRDAGLIDRDAVAMVTAEPTGGVIWHACRGAITMRVTVHGREAHVGLAHQGDNAFEHLIRVARPVTELAQELLDERTELAADSEAAKGSMMVVGGSLGAGANFNVVPGSAWFSVDWRFNPERTLEAELTRLIETIHSAADRAGADVTIDILQEQPSGATEPSDPQVSRLAECVAAVEGQPPRLELCPGVLETRWYSQLGIPALGYGGGRLDISHGPNEFIDEDAMRRCAAVYALYAAKTTR
jgi:acetylornithine deacetylase/succinyl-diaminopimelate desuccinylase-like protein